MNRRPGTPVRPARRTGPLDNPRRLSRLMPFILSGVLGITAVLAVNTHRLTAAEYGTLVVAGALLLVLLVTTPWERLPAAWQVAPPLGAVAFIALVRHLAGGPPSGATFLLIIPIAWSALHGTGGETLAVIGAAALAVVLPALIDPAYPFTEFARASTLLVVAALLAWALRRGQRTARTDPLTGLPNRRAWDDALTGEISRASHTGAPGTLVLIDIDHFKAFNDAFGHASGDQLLRDAGAAWSRVLRRYDVLARIGGEEFGVLLPGVPPERALAVADRLRRAMPAGQACSCGLVPIEGGEDPLELFSIADGALYRAKALGRNRSVLVRS